MDKRQNQIDKINSIHQEQQSKRKEIADDLLTFGNQYFSTDWVNEKILGSKMPKRKRKIKSIFNE